MLPIFNKDEQHTIEKDENLVARRQPVLVYKARVNSTVTITNISTDWMLFMDDLYSEMFNKISF